MFNCTDEEFREMERQVMILNPPRPPRSRIATSWVYFIRAGAHGPIKIGVAVDVSRRLRFLQVGHHEDLLVQGVVPGGLPLERELHGRFSDLRIRGEWFRPEPELLSYILENATPPD